jgi:hypothetical protein
MVLGTLFKAVILLVGMGVVLWHLVKGITTGDKAFYLKALKYFFLTVAVIITLSVFEFLLFSI